MRLSRFTRRRGRPKVEIQENDHGTPELQRKRAAEETAETLDLCLGKGLISLQQHWCGIHFRWLYTLRYGAPSVRALDLLHVDGIDIPNDDPSWRESREAEYHEAALALANWGYLRLLTNICVHNQRPDFLKSRNVSDYKTLAELRDGLDILVTHWRRSKKSNDK